MSRQELWGTIPGGNSNSESGSYPKSVELPEQKRTFQLAWLLHILSLLSIIVAWHYLSAWSIYWQQRDYFKFALFLTFAFLVGPARSVIGWLKYSSPRRLIIALGVAILAIPWGELLQQISVTGRENWSMQILAAFAFVYSSFLLFRAIPIVADFLQGIVDFTIRIFDSYPLLFSLPPFLFLCLCAWIAFHIFQRIPLIQDSAAHLFQAKIFASGRLFAPAPRPLDFFSVSGDMLVTKDGRWFSMYLPGYSLVLSLAVLLRAEYLLSPLLGMATIAIWISYARRWHEQAASTIYCFLLVFSPFLFLMYSTIMVHCLELFLASAMIYLARRETEESSPARIGLLCGVAILAVITRGFSLIPFLMPALLFLFYHQIRRKQLVVTALICASILLGAALIAFYQWKTTGNPLMPGYNLETSHGYGLGKEIAGHRLSAIKALQNVSNEILGLNSWLTGWYSGSLFFFLLFLLFARFEKWDLLLLAGFVILLCFYFFYPIQDLILGPRFYFLAAPYFLLCIARTPFLSSFRHEGMGRWIGALLVLSFLTFFPQSFSTFLHRKDPAGSEFESLKKIIDAERTNKILILLNPEARQDLVNWNDPFFRDNVILSNDLGDNRELLERFRKYRPLYFRSEAKRGGAIVQDGFGVFAQQATLPAGYISLLQIAMRMEAASGEWDCFDVVYGTSFRAPVSDLRLRYLQKMLMEHSEERPYKQEFREGMIHAARLFLLPKAAYEKNEEQWQKFFNAEDFLNELHAAMAAFQASGEVGKIMSDRLLVVSKRIDINGDGTSTPQEVRAFVAKKLE